MRIGVISRIDGTDADVIWILGLTVSSSDARSITRDRFFRDAPLSLEIADGKLVEAISSVDEGITEINTAGTLEARTGNVTPAVGDLVAEFRRDGGGDLSAFASIQYITDRDD